MSKPAQFESGGPWSLYEMIERLASDFVRIATEFDKILRILPRSAEMDGGHPTDILLEETRQSILVQLSNMENACKCMGASDQEMLIYMLANSFRGTRVSVQDSRVRVSQCRDNYIQFWSKWQVILLSEKDCALLTDPKPFGAKFWRKFKAARPDAEEAAKCRALGRWNGALFHILRVSEFALNALVVMTGTTVRDTAPWGVAIDEIEREIKKPGCTLTRPQKDFATGLMGFMQPLKFVRNSRSMHVDEPLCDQATVTALYQHVETFVKHVAEHLDETGRYV